MGTKHTPGPFEAIRHSDPTPGVGYYEIVKRYGRLDEPVRIASLTDTYYRNKFRLEANARLFAASPDLLEALYLALPYVEGAFDDECFKKGAVKTDIIKIRQAIAKAVG